MVASKEAISGAVLSLVLKNTNGASLFKVMNTRYAQRISIPGEEKPCLISLRFQFPHLSKGKYTVSFEIKSGPGASQAAYHLVNDALIVEVDNEQLSYRTDAVLAIPIARFQLHSSFHDMTSLSS